MKNVKYVLKKILGIYDFDREAEKRIKKSILLFHKKSFISHIRSIRLYNSVRKKFNCDIWPGIEFGDNNYIAHPNNILIGKTSVIGNNCRIYPNCQLIAALKNDDYLYKNNIRRHPCVGNNVTIGAGSILIGPINVGSNVIIGAGAIVTKDVPSGATVIGVNKVILKKQ